MISNYQRKISLNTKPSLITLTLEKPGLLVSPSKKSEINQHADHAGPSEQLRPCLIDFVSLQDRRTRPESPLKTCFHVVDSPAEWVATVDSQVELGASSKDQDSLPVTNTTTITGAEPTLLLPVSTILKESIHHVEPHNPLPSVIKPVTPNLNVSTIVIRSKLRTHTVSQVMLPKFKLKS